MWWMLACTGTDTVEEFPEVPSSFEEAVAAVPAAIGLRWRLDRIDTSDDPPIAVLVRSGLRGEVQAGLGRVTETLVGWDQIPSYVTGDQGDDLVVVVAGPGKGGPLTIARSRILLAAEGAGGEPAAFPPDFSVDRLRADIEGAVGSGTLVQLACDEYPCLAALNWPPGEEEARGSFGEAMASWGEATIHEAGVVVGPSGPTTLMIASWDGGDDPRLVARAGAISRATKNAARGLRP